MNGLSKLASCIGNPICMDEQTANGKRLAFAKVLVEVLAASTLPNSLTIACNGTTFVQEVVYQWKPRSCDTCKSFIHCNLSCPIQQAEKQHFFWSAIELSEIASSTSRREIWLDKAPKNKKKIGASKRLTKGGVNVRFFRGIRSRNRLKILWIWCNQSRIFRKVFRYPLDQK